jgi:hypothetical protein
MNEIFKPENFKTLKDLDKYNLNFAGIYALRIKNISTFPLLLRNEIENKESLIIYIGKASKNLGRRLEEECRGKSHGTFFRGIGAILNFKPPRGSLIGKSNLNNYKFNLVDSEKIIKWMNENLEFECLKTEKNIDFIEKDLIKHFEPILNTNHNPKKSKYLATVRQECRNIAQERYSN